MHLLLRAVGSSVPGELKAWIPGNKESVGPEPLTLALGLATAPLCLYHHKMSPSSTFPQPGLVPWEAGELGLWSTQPRQLWA